jgi:hypothetical protein
MRTTITLDDDAYQIVRRYAEARCKPMGKAVSELVRRGSQAPLRTRLVGGFHVVDLPAGSHPITTEDVKRLLAESE